MPDILDRFAPVFNTPEQERQWSDLQEAKRPGFGRVIRDAISSEWATSWAFRQGERARFAADPNFEWTSDLWDEMTKGVPSDMHSEFINAQSADEAEMIRAQMLNLAETRMRLQSAGMTGSIARIGASLVDPVAAGAALLSGGAIGYAGRGARLSRLVEAGLVGGLSDTAVSSYIASQDPEMDANDVLIGAAGGVALGLGGEAIGRALRRISRGAELDQISALARREGKSDWREVVGDKARYEGVKPPEVAAEKMVNDVAKVEDQIDGVIPDTPEEVAKFKELPPGNPDEAGQTRTNPDTETPHTGLGATTGEFVPPLPQRGAGLTAPGQKPPEAGFDDFDLGGVEDPFDVSSRGAYDRASVPGLRGLANALRSKANPIKAWFGRVVLTETIPGTTPLRESAVEWMNRNIRRVIAHQWQPEVEAAFDGYARARGLNWLQRTGILWGERDKFMREVGDAVIAGKLWGPASDPFVERARKRVAEIFKETLGKLKRHGVGGFENVPDDEAFLPWAWNVKRIADAEATHGTDAVVGLVQGAMYLASKKAGYTHDADVLREVAELFVQSIKDSRYGLKLDDTIPFTNAASDIKSILNIIAPNRKGNERLISIAKGRFLMERSFALDLPTGQLKLTDLAETNIDTLIRRYTRAAHGAMVHAEILRALNHYAKAHTGVGVETIADVVEMVKRLDADVGYSAEKSVADADAIERVLGHMLGKPLDPHGMGTTVSRAIMDYNYMIRGGGFALAQIPEFGVQVAEGGWRTLLKNPGGVFEALASVITGKSDRALEQLATLAAMGNERWLNQVVPYFDSAEEGLQSLVAGPGLRGLRRARRLMADASGLSYISMALNRTAAFMAMDTWARMAKGTAKMFDGFQLRGMGLDEERAGKILENLAAHAELNPGDFGKQVVDFNFHKWDAVARRDFITAVDKWASRVVQRENIGDMALWMEKPMARMLIQFKRFPIVAWEKQALYNVARLPHNPAAAITGLTLPMLLGLAVYSSRIWASSQLADNPQEYRAKYMTPRLLALAGFSRGGASALLPTALDSVTSMATGESATANIRTSGLEMNPVYGNPTFSLVQSAWDSLLRIPYKLGTEQDVNKQDFRNARGLLWFQNLTGVKQILDSMQNELPNE